MRITYINLKNFQSHESSKIGLSNGLNVIIGSSNNGKSSIVRAARCLFYNDWNKTYVTTGQKEAVIEVELEDGTIITKTKGAGVNKISYKTLTDFQEYSGFGDDVPSNIIKMLGCGPIVLDEDKKFFINIANQQDAIFLLNESGSFKSKVLGYISGMHIIDGVVRDVNSDGRLQVSNLKQAENDAELFKLKLAEFDILELSRLEIIELQRVIAEQEAIGTKVSEYMALLGEIDSFNARYNAYAAKMITVESTSESALRKEFTDKMAAYGVCPLCGVEMTVDSISKNTSHV